MAPIERLSLECSLTDHCNLACYGCDHASPLLPRFFTDLEGFRADLLALRDVLHVQKLYLIGGEPLLHPQVVDFAEAAYASGLAQGIVLVTNGVLLHTMPDRMWELLSGINITRYPGITLRASFESLVANALRHRVVLRVRRASRFRHTLLNAPLPDQAAAKAIFDACKITHSYGCHSLYDGRYYKCSVAPTLSKRLTLLHLHATGWDSDGVLIRGNPNARSDLERYLANQEPLAACTYCLGTAGHWTRHHQLSAEGRRAWLQEDHAKAMALIDPTQLPALARRTQQ